MPHEESVQDTKPRRMLYPRLAAVDGVILPMAPVEEAASTAGEKTSPMSGFIMGEFSGAETGLYLMESDSRGDSQKSGTVRGRRISRLRSYRWLARLWSGW
jgi:hypothetical protein